MSVTQLAEAAQFLNATGVLRNLQAQSQRFHEEEKQSRNFKDKKAFYGPLALLSMKRDK